MRRYSPVKTLHAEVDALLGARRRDYKGASILVYRELSGGKFGLAKPCHTCMEIIKLFKIKTIWYTDINGIRKEELK
jgi:deoxycytidylate deaminase